MANQDIAKQQNALISAVLVRVENIENPTVLINTLQSIGKNHVSLNIKPKQYDIVGNHLIGLIKEV